jgi:hypothetical protein
VGWEEGKPRTAEPEAPDKPVVTAQATQQRHTQPPITITRAQHEQSGMQSGPAHPGPGLTQRGGMARAAGDSQASTIRDIVYGLVGGLKDLVGQATDGPRSSRAPAQGQAQGPAVQHRDPPGVGLLDNACLVWTQRWTVRRRGKDGRMHLDPWDG